MQGHIANRQIVENNPLQYAFLSAFLAGKNKTFVLNY